jgi:uncharacterized protein (DUF2141 family)
MKCLLVFLLGFILILPYNQKAIAQEKGKITICFENLNNSNGHIIAALYNKKDGFPQDRSKVFMSTKAEIKDKKAYLTFENVPFGEYAIASFHDENDNGVMDKNFFGIPKEKYGFSNNPKVLFSAPSFDDSKFMHKLSETSIIIKMK